MMKVKNKKIIAIIAVVLVAILAIVLAMLFTRCGNHSSATPDQAQATTATIAKGDTTSTQLSTDASGKVIDPTTNQKVGGSSPFQRASMSVDNGLKLSTLIFFVIIPCRSRFWSAPAFSVCAISFAFHHQADLPCCVGNISVGIYSTFTPCRVSAV